MFSPSQGASASNSLFGNPLGAFGAIGVQIAGWIRGGNGVNAAANASAQSQAAMDALNAANRPEQTESQIGNVVLYGLGALIVIALIVWLVRIAVKG
jgi:hypothetical protein